MFPENLRLFFMFSDYCLHFFVVYKKRNSENTFFDLLQVYLELSLLNSFSTFSYFSFPLFLLFNLNTHVNKNSSLKSCLFSHSFYQHFTLISSPVILLCSSVLVQEIIKGWQFLKTVKCNKQDGSIYQLKSCVKIMKKNI